jgi:hypothetical protein
MREPGWSSRVLSRNANGANRLGFWPEFHPVNDKLGGRVIRLAYTRPLIIVSSYDTNSGWSAARQLHRPVTHRMPLTLFRQATQSYSSTREIPNDASVEYRLAWLR